MGENFDDSPNGARLSDVLIRQSENFVCEGIRFALVATEWNGLFKKLELLLEILMIKINGVFLRAKIYLLLKMRFLEKKR